MSTTGGRTDRLLRATIGKISSYRCSILFNLRHDISLLLIHYLSDIDHQKNDATCGPFKKNNTFDFSGLGGFCENISGNKSKNRPVSHLYSCQTAWAFPSDSRLNLRWPPWRLRLPPTKLDFVFLFFLSFHCPPLCLPSLFVCRRRKHNRVQREGHQQQVCLMQTDPCSSSPPLSIKG